MAYALHSRDHLYGGLVSLLSTLGAHIRILAANEAAGSFHYVLAPFNPAEQSDLPTYARALRRQWEHLNRFLLFSASRHGSEDIDRARAFGLDVVPNLASLLRQIAICPERLPPLLVQQLVEDDLRARCRIAAHNLHGVHGRDEVQFATDCLRDAIARGLWSGPLPEEPCMAAAVSAVARGKRQ